MTVEQLIKSAISKEVEDQLNPDFVKEIVNKKTERLTKRILKNTTFEDVVRRSFIYWLQSWDGQKFIRSIVADAITISVTKKD